MTKKSQTKPSKVKKNILRHEAYEKVKTMILQNKINSGRKLNEKEIATFLNLSRTPLRESFIMLEKENLITHAEDRGFYIRRFSLKDLRDLYEFRNYLETAFVELIIERATDEKVSGLADFLGQMKTTIKDDIPAKALVQGLEFHVKFIALSENAIAIEAMKNCCDKLTLIGWSTQKSESVNKSYEEHREILSALRKRDKTKLQINIQNHISKAKERSLDILSQDDKLYLKF